MDRLTTSGARRVFDSKEMVDQLKAEGMQGEFEIAANRDFYRGPIIDVAAEAPTSEEALHATDLVTRELDAQLKALQENQKIDPNYFIRTAPVVKAAETTTVLTGTVRMLILVGGLGTVLTVGAGLLADALSRRRSDSSDRTDSSDRSTDDDDVAGGRTPAVVGSDAAASVHMPPPVSLTPPPYRPKPADVWSSVSPPMPG